MLARHILRNKLESRKIDLGSFQVYDRNAILPGKNLRNGFFRNETQRHEAVAQSSSVNLLIGKALMKLARNNDFFRDEQFTDPSRNPSGHAISPMRAVDGNPSYVSDSEIGNIRAAWGTRL